MNSRILDCLVENFENRVNGLFLPDKNDRHVLAAAIECQADYIVTFNLKDFPKKSLDEFQVEAIHPDEFIMRIAFLSPNSLLESANDIRKRLNHPSLSVEQYLEVLIRQRLVKSVEFLLNYKNLL